jgi:type IV pilus assembly protein PilO
MALADSLKADKLIKLPWYQKAAILGVIAAVIMVFYFLTLDRTYKSQISKQADDISKLQKQITDLKTIAEDLPKFERQNAMLKKELDKAMTKLPAKPQIDEMLKDVTFKAKTYGVEVVTFNISPEMPQTLYVEVPVKMKLKSNFFPLMIFFNELARMERILNISDLNIVISQKESLLDIACTLTAYRFKEATAAGEETKGKGKKPAPRGDGGE